MPSAFFNGDSILPTSMAASSVSMSECLRHADPLAPTHRYHRLVAGGGKVQNRELAMA